jgi:AraC-like DNA-binding protein
LTRKYAELALIDAMLVRAARGLSFGDAIRDAVRPRLLALVDASPASRWLGLVDILIMLASDASCQPLSLRGFVPLESARDRARLERVLTHLHKHYAQPVRLSALATLAAMSESQLQRFFKRCTRVTVSDYLAQLRIGHACALLLDRDRPIALIAEQAGYSQPSYFTRQFRAVKGMTPMEFRRRFTAGA